MRLIEAASKAVLARHGLRPPDGRLCATGAEARAAATELAGPVYVKAQIPFGDRATLGLVERADEPEAAGRAAEEQLRRSVDGTRVAAVLVERAVAADVSAYVSVHVDDAAAARVLRVGLGGGAGYRPQDAEVEAVIAPGGLELFQLRGLLGALGLS